MTLEHFARLLKDAMGLDVVSVGAAALERAIAERQRARRMDDLAGYWTCVQTSHMELQSLIEAVVVPETWFFRDPQAFAALGSEVLIDWQRKPRDGPLRLLSLPCSTGEEPYSMAMALLDAGLQRPQFRIDAMDISERVLAHARLGVFGVNAFRGKDLTFRDRHFNATATGYQITDGVRETVRFQQGNLLSPDLLAGAEIYDVIFCRNVLIYFDRETQSRCVSTLSRLLKADGFLFVGASESGVLSSHDFVSMKLPMAFAFRQAVISGERMAGARKPATTSAAGARRPAPAATMVRGRHPMAVAPIATLAAPSHPTVDTGHGLEQARRLADQGRFVEAAICCNAEMQRNGPSAEAYYLLGLVRDGSGNQREAADYYRKVIYLDPNHGEALMHLALLLEGDGKASEARVVRNRIRRLKQQSGT